MSDSPAEWWHAVWTTFLTRSPADPRGDWSKLATAYSGRAEGVEMSDPLGVRWQGRVEAEDAVRLSPVAREMVARGIVELAGSERVAGEPPIRILAVQSQAVQVVLACPRELLHQRVGRLKSRTATLLSFDPAAGAGGKATCSRDFWWARLGDEDVIAAVASFVKRLDSPEADREAVPLR